MPRADIRSVADRAHHFRVAQDPAQAAALANALGFDTATHVETASVNMVQAVRTTKPAEPAYLLPLNSVAAVFSVSASAASNNSSKLASPAHIVGIASTLPANPADSVDALIVRGDKSVGSHRSYKLALSPLGLTRLLRTHLPPLLPGLQRVLTQALIEYAVTTTAAPAAGDAAAPALSPAAAAVKHACHSPDAAGASHVAVAAYRIAAPSAEELKQVRVVPVRPHDAFTENVAFCELNVWQVLCGVKSANTHNKLREAAGERLAAAASEPFTGSQLLVKHRTLFNVAQRRPVYGGRQLSGTVFVVSASLAAAMIVEAAFREHGPSCVDLLAESALRHFSSMLLRRQEAAFADAQRSQQQDLQHLRAATQTLVRTADAKPVDVNSPMGAELANLSGAMGLHWAQRNHQAAAKLVADRETKLSEQALSEYDNQEWLRQQCDPVVLRGIATANGVAYLAAQPAVPPDDGGVAPQPAPPPFVLEPGPGPLPAGAAPLPDNASAPMLDESPNREGMGLGGAPEPAPGPVASIDQPKSQHGSRKETTAVSATVSCVDAMLKAQNDKVETARGKLVARQFIGEPLLQLIVSKLGVGVSGPSASHKERERLRVADLALAETVSHDVALYVDNIERLRIRMSRNAFAKLFGQQSHIATFGFLFAAANGRPIQVTFELFDEPTIPRVLSGQLPSISAVLDLTPEEQHALTQFELCFDGHCLRYWLTTGFCDPVSRLQLLCTQPFKLCLSADCPRAQGIVQFNTHKQYCDVRSFDAAPDLLGSL